MPQFSPEVFINVDHMWANTGPRAAFGPLLAESTELSDTAQLAIFIRGVDEEFTDTEELVALQLSKGSTT
ncbi:hypothetical protein EVAR_15866_1 [Eumeta japonica]|uniref:General transcription factor II-I repeat domain-containing protein 2 n=1 Tax=Eumeta variegata TaxID=151549 RepID=A0A4C1UEV8_EUMVA|nr:hypothetical protein EVAR_15866_1 [Eumeta japonica]